jgi:putative hemolysin
LDPHQAGTYEGLLLALLCAAIGSVFAAAESAFASLNPARLALLEQTASGRRRRALERYLANRPAAHAHWLVGRVLFTAFAALLVANAIASTVPRWALAPLGALGALLTYGVVAEVATTWARSRPEYFAARVLGLIRPLELLVYPLSAPLSLIGRLVGGLLGGTSDRQPKVTETEVEWVINEGQKQGSLAQEPAEMIRHVLELKDLVARDVMIPRTRVSAIDLTRELADVLHFVRSEGHSRYPVYRDSIDNTIGLLYAKDLFRIVVDGALQDTPLEQVVRTPVIFVPETQGVSSVLREMRARRQHLAVVIDEFGGFSGIVTLEDILEVIVGEIRDEYDTEEAPIQDLGDGRLLADAAVSVHDLSSYLGTDIPGGGDYESVGGLVVHESGRVPAVGVQVDAHGMSFIVREADEKRVVKVEIVRHPTVPPPHALDELADGVRSNQPEPDPASVPPSPEVPRSGPGGSDPTSSAEGTKDGTETKADAKRASFAP